MQQDQKISANSLDLPILSLPVSFWPFHCPPSFWWITSAKQSSCLFLFHYSHANIAKEYFIGKGWRKAACVSRFSASLVWTILNANWFCMNRSSRDSARQEKGAVPNSSRTNPESARSIASSRVPESGRSQADVPSSSRSNIPSSSRSNPATMETGRTYMDTARVHTALAALGAEKQALLAKLQMIDTALETGEKKKASQPRPKK